MKNQKGITLLIAIIIILVVVLIGGGAVYYYYATKTQPKSAACTEEAKVCPDGSSVGRTGPNCEFATCPAIDFVQPADETAEVKKGNVIEIDPQAIEKERQVCSKNNDSFCYLNLALMTDKKEMCEAIIVDDLKKGDYKNFCLAILQKDITKCQYADGQSGIKALSILCSAIVKKDYGMCNNNELKEGMGVEMDEICPGWVNHYNNMADKKFFDPVAYCQGNDYKKRSFSTVFLYEIKEQCYLESINMIIDFAKPSSYDQKICNLLIGMNKDACYSKVAVKKKDINICGMISNSGIKDMCLAVVGSF